MPAANGLVVNITPVILGDKRRYLVTLTYGIVPAAERMSVIFVRMHELCE